MIESISFGPVSVCVCRHGYGPIPVCAPTYWPEELGGSGGSGDVGQSKSMAEPGQQ